MTLSTANKEKHTCHSDKLKLVLDQIIEKCKELEIYPFFGLVAEEEPPMTVWSKDNPGKQDWQDFLLAFKGAKARMLHIASYSYNFNPEEEQAFIGNGLSLLEEDEQEEFRTALAKLQGRKGHIAAIDLIFEVDGSYYRYEFMAEWYNAFASITTTMLYYREQCMESESEGDH